MKLAAFLLCFIPAFAQIDNRPPILRDVGIEQKLNAQVSSDLAFVDDSGKSVKLGDYLGERPVVLALVYYQCPMLCNQILNGMLRSLNEVSLDAGKEFDVVAVSIDPRETPAMAAAKKQTYIDKYRHKSTKDGWHFLTGTDASIRRLADTVGYRYAFNPVTNQFAHASGIMVLTPSGQISRYFYGIEYPSRDLRLGLVEASAGKIGALADQVLLFCYHYDPSQGKYGLAIMNMLRVLGSATVLGLGAMIITMVRRDR